MARVAGIDFGSDAVRVIVIDTRTGEAELTVRSSYRRWAAGRYCTPAASVFRQHPSDHLEALESCFEQIAAVLGEGSVGALAIDTTGSTVAPVDEHGVPLALLPEFADDPDAMFWLWKDRSSASEADELNVAFTKSDPDYTTYQGLYSSEWWWAKILNAVRRNPRIREAAHSWVEHSDWLPNLLTGQHNVEGFQRNACAAGHKALFNRRLGGHVPSLILNPLDPYLGRLADTLRVPVVAGTPIGGLSPEWASRLKLTPGAVVAMGSLDAHAGAVGAGVQPGTLVKVMGTSTVDLFVLGYDDLTGEDTRGRCGLAEDSIIPGLLGGEAGQSAFGDLFAWLTKVLMWPVDALLASKRHDTLAHTELAEFAGQARAGLLQALEREASTRPPTTVRALDWINGRRYPHPDDAARAALLNLHIGHDAVDLYQALVDAAVLGSMSIYESLGQAGLSFSRVILVGGIAEKSAYIGQAVADALGLEAMVSHEAETCARGAAMYAAVGAGVFPDLQAAQAKWCAPFSVDFRPNPAGVKRYRQALELYNTAGRLTSAALNTH